MATGRINQIAGEGGQRASRAATRRPAEGAGGVRGTRVSLDDRARRFPTYRRSPGRRPADNRRTPLSEGVG